MIPFKSILFKFILVINLFFVSLAFAQMDISKYPNAEISNEFISMKLLLPDPDKGSYRATRFDWSGIIASLQYHGHEYFSYWKDTHDPFVHEDISGPVESYGEQGLGYAEAKPGEGFIRIGVGILEKIDEEEFVWSKTYKITDHGKWKIKQGKDWIEFQHTLNSDFGYKYVYIKRIILKDEEPGFKIIHTLKNTGTEVIETDQYNHNFFTIDRQQTGPGFSIKVPFTCTTDNDLKGLMKITQNELSFIKFLEGKSIWLELQGYGSGVEDHQVTVVNNKTGAGVQLSVDKPLHRMVFWACETTICPENYIFLSINPGEEETWISDYKMFANAD